jgi:hypothetical protein
MLENQTSARVPIRVIENLPFWIASKDIHPSPERSAARWIWISRAQVKAPFPVLRLIYHRFVSRPLTSCGEVRPHRTYLRLP